MSTFEHIIRQAHRRQLASLALRRSGWGVCIAFVAALLLLVIDRIANLQLSPFIFAGLVAAGFIGGWVQAMAIGPDRLAVAVQLDRSLRLKDRLGTAQAVRNVAKAPVHHDEDFASLVQRDAQKLADSIDVRSATPIRITGIWGTACSLAFVLTVGFLYLPSLERAMHERSAEHVALTNKQTPEQAREMTQVISQAIADVPKGGLDSKAQEDLAALDRLMQQMSSRQASPDQVDAARDESAARLDELAERMAEQSQRDKAASDELAKRFSGIDQTGAPKPPLSAKEFSEAIKRGDFGAAAEKLDELLKGASVPEDDRRAAAEHMRDLARRIDQANQGPAKDQAAQELREHLSQALRDQGVDEKTIDELMENPPQSPEQISQKLRQNNVDEEIARDLARDIDRLREEKDVDEQVKQDTRDVSDALDRAADEVENPPPPPPPPQATSAPEEPQQNESATSQPQQPPQQDRPKQDQNSSQQDGRQSGDTSNSTQSRESKGAAQQQQQQQSGATTKPGAQSPQNRDSKGAAEHQQGDQRSSDQSTDKPDRPSGERQQQQQSQKQGESGSTQPDRSSSSRNGDRQGAAESQPSNQQPSNQNTDKTDRASGEHQQQNQQQPSNDSAGQQRTGERQPNAQPGDEQSPKSGERSDQPQGAQRQGASDQQANKDQRGEGQQKQQQADPNSRDQQEQQQQGQQGQSGQPDQSPSDVLRRLAERPGNAQDREQSAEKLRELAKQFMKNTAPEQRKQWAEQWLKENGKQQQDQQDTRQAQKNPQQDSANEPPSEDQQKLARELEDIARELAKDMSPEERREWMERAEKLRQQQQANRQPDPSMMADDNPDSKDDPAHPPRAGSSSKGSRTGQGRPNQTDDSPHQLAQEDGADKVDLRGRETADRIIAQWLSDQENPKTPDAQHGVSEAPASVRRAQDVAQRAVNDSAVQKRYHNTIKRYFGRLNETIKKAAGGNAAPAPAPTNGASESPAPPAAPAPDPGTSP